jgi:hypothetical protein
VEHIKIIVPLALLFFIVPTHIDLRNKHPSSELAVNDVTAKQQPPTANHWLQPEFLNDRYPQLIGSNDWQLDFMTIEEKISKLKLNSDHSLLINGDTADILQLINIELSENIPDKQWQRLRFLLIKSLGDNAGESFYKLVNAYYSYEKAQQSQWLKIKTSSPNEKFELLKRQNINIRKIQAQYFDPEIASKLFHEKNQTTDYLNSRRIINMDKNLSSEQKKHQLSILVKIYKESLGNR